MSEEHRITLTVRAIGFGLTKTLPFTKQGITSLRKLIDFVETQMNEGEALKEELQK